MVNLKIKNQHGFTLLELIIYIAILSGFLLVISSIFFTISFSSTREDVRLEVQRNLHFAIQKIMSDVRSASVINVPAGGENGNILNITINGVEVNYSVLNGVLQRTSSGITENITNDKTVVSTESFIFSRTFSSGARPTIQVILKISYKDNGIPDYIFSDKIQTSISGNEMQAEITPVPTP